MIRRDPTFAMLALLALWVAVAPRSAAAKPHAGSSRASAKSSSPAKRHRPAGRDTTSAGGSRTLDEIHIEGEVAVPQVLFITARDQRRILDFQNHRYLPTSRQLAESTVYPNRIQTNTPDAIEARKEPSR